MLSISLTPYDKIFKEVNIMDLYSHQKTIDLIPTITKFRSFLSIVHSQWVLENSILS